MGVPKDILGCARPRGRNPHFIPRIPGCKVGWISLAARRRDRISAGSCCTAYVASWHEAADRQCPL
jgi:hypothetical protein